MIGDRVVMMVATGCAIEVVTAVVIVCMTVDDS